MANKEEIRKIGPWKVTQERVLNNNRGQPDVRLALHEYESKGIKKLQLSKREKVYNKEIKSYVEQFVNLNIWDDASSRSLGEALLELSEQVKA